MSKYKTLIFDLDDTLIDNNESVKYAFNSITKFLKIDFSEKFFEDWKLFDKTYWHIWESGKMIVPDSIKTLEDKVTYLRTNRFMLFFENLKTDWNKAIKINELYSKMLGVNIVEISDAKKLLQSLKSSYEIIIATNGPKDAAINKLEKTELNSYVSLIVSAEEIGYSKPMPEFFDFLLEKSENKDKSKMLLIGDSLTTDVFGGNKIGIDTCWFNPNSAPLPDEYKPTMTINKLLELKKML